MQKPLSYIDISKSALISNIKQFRTFLSKDNKLVLVVKANAYGHGLEEIVRISSAFVDMFQVDDIEELRVVRKITNKRVLVLGYVQKQDLDDLVDLNGTLGCYNIETIKILNSIARRKNIVQKIHLKIDALLGRQGILINDIPDILKVLEQSKYIELESVYSHFSNIEDVSDLAHAKKQFKYLVQAKTEISNNGFKGVAHHISATSGLMTDLVNNWSGCLVRLGIGAYGLWPSVQLKRKLKNKINLNPVLTWVTSVAQTKKIPKGFPIGYGLTFVSSKPMRIAVIPQGYSDGYDRGLSNRSFVLIRGKKCKVLGRVAMNMFVVDATSVPGICLEDEVVLMGKQGKSEVTAEMLAEEIGTINYEIVARLSSALPRIVTK